MEREDARAQGLTWDEYLEQTVAHRPIARMATPEEIAFGVLYPRERRVLVCHGRRAPGRRRWGRRLTTSTARSP